MSMSLTHLSLFTGIGGIDLAAEWAGFRTIGQVEIDDYATAVLEKHWPNVPRWRDVKDVTARSFREKTKEYRSFLLTGGFPCQPVSYAGKRCGQKDDRWLWPEMLRIVRELRPAWIVGENVPGLVRMGLDTVLGDLENLEYSTRAFDIPAVAVGAWHLRERIFIVAHTGHSSGWCQPGMQPHLPKESPAGREGRIYPSAFSNPTSREDDERKRSILDEAPHGGGCGNAASLSCCKNIPHPKCLPGAQPGPTSGMGGLWESDPRLGRGIWDVEPCVGRVADGVPSRVDRLRCLGNAVVPQQVYPILKGIAEIESIDKVS